MTLQNNLLFTDFNICLRICLQFLRMMYISHGTWRDFAADYTPSDNGGRDEICKINREERSRTERAPTFLADYDQLFLLDLVKSRPLDHPTRSNNRQLRSDIIIQYARCHKRFSDKHFQNEHVSRYHF